MVKTTRLIVLMGLPGSGKSTLAKKLRDEYNFVVLSGEEMTIQMFGTDKCRAEEYKLVYKKLRQEAKKLLESGKEVVIDGTNLKHEYRQEIYNEIDWKDTILIYLKVDDKTALERLKKRGGCDKKTFYEFKKQLKEPKGDEKAIWVKNKTENLKEVIKAVK